MEWTDIQGKKYPGYGRCIYCGENGGAEGLRDEHVIPFSLGGRTIIEKASCRDCERRINPVDTHLARAVFWQFRIHANVPTRNPKDRPSTLPADITLGDRQFSLDLPIGDHPFSLALPIWGDAGFFAGGRIDQPFPEPYVHIYHWAPPNLADTLGLQNEQEFKIWSKWGFDTTLFARGIAKIAYCHTVIMYGLDGFRSLVVPDIILGRFSGVSYFVGGPLTIPPAPYKKGQRHLVRHIDLDADPAHEKVLGSSLKLHLVYVRLFADSAHEQHGMPIYHVITGARTPPRTRHRRVINDAPKIIAL